MASSGFKVPVLSHCPSFVGTNKSQHNDDWSTGSTVLLVLVTRRMQQFPSGGAQAGLLWELKFGSFDSIIVDSIAVLDSAELNWPEEPGLLRSLTIMFMLLR